jgi:proteasome assembly chaperone 3
MTPLTPSKIQASISPTAPLPTLTDGHSHPNAQLLPQPPIAIQLTQLLGSAPSEYMQTLHSLFATQIATIIWAAEAEGHEHSRRNVVVGIALRNSQEVPGTGLNSKDRAMFREVMTMLQELLQTAAWWRGSP